MKPSQPSRVTEALDRVDNYVQTIQAIVSFAHVLTIDFKGSVWFGKLRTSPNNQVQPNTEVTPDVTGSIGDYDIVVEVKKSFTQNEDYWDESFSQIKKYDDVLTRSDGKTLSNQDLVLLTHIVFSYRVSKYAANLLDGKIHFHRRFSILEFSRTTQRQTFIFLRKQYGEISHSDLQTRLNEGIPVPLERIVQRLAGIKFYDSEPDVIYTMALLWDQVFNTFPTKEERRASRGTRTIQITVNIEKVLEILRDSYAPPDRRDVIRRKWVERAMYSFQKLGLASPTTKPNEYTVYYREIKAKSLSYFVERLYGRAQEKLESYISHGDRAVASS